MTPMYEDAICAHRHGQPCFAGHADQFKPAMRAMRYSACARFAGFGAKRPAHNPGVTTPTANQPEAKMEMSGQHESERHSA